MSMIERIKTALDEGCMSEDLIKDLANLPDVTGSVIIDPGFMLDSFIMIGAFIGGEHLDYIKHATVRMFQVDADHLVAAFLFRDTRINELINFPVIIPKDQWKRSPNLN